MTKRTERELHRLSGLLSKIERRFALSRGEVMALRKSAIALSLAFINGLKPTLDYHYRSLGKPLTQKDKQFLKEMGVEDD